MKKILTYVRYFTDFLQYGQLRLVIASVVYILTGKSFIQTRIFRGKLGYFLHRKGSLDFQFGNYAYEWNVKEVMLKHLHSYDVFFDVGANIGSYTIMLAGSGLRTYAFEPVYSNYKALNINILLNDLESKVTAFNFGLGNETRPESFSFDPLNTGASHISSHPADTLDAEKRSIATTIQITKLDDIVSSFELKETDRILMKIDVEGMEIEVLQGAAQFLKSRPKVMLIIESVHSGEEQLKKVLSEIDEFEFFSIDSLNMGAFKDK